MEESQEVVLCVTMKSGRIYKIKTSTTQIDWLYNKIFGRESGNFQNFGNQVINITEIEYFYFEEDEG